MSNPVKEKDGSTRYYNDEKRLHREDGPAIIWGEGGQEWWINGKLHRQDGPAVEYDNAKIWFIQGARHREDGPAVLFNNDINDGNNQYYLNGKEVIVDSLTEFIGIVRFKAFI